MSVGGYPDKPGDLPALLGNTFVCLNSEYGEREFVAYAKNIPTHQFIWEPINDMKIVADSTIIALADKIVLRLSNCENIYLHCAGGHGRTGTVAAVVLHKLYPQLSVDEIFDYLQFAHDQRDGNYFGYRLFTYKMIDDPMAQYFMIGQVPTPQTLAQRDQVRRIV